MARECLPLAICTGSGLYGRLRFDLFYLPGFALYGQLSCSLFARVPPPMGTSRLLLAWVPPPRRQGLGGPSAVLFAQILPSMGASCLLCAWLWGRTWERSRPLFALVPPSMGACRSLFAEVPPGRGRALGALPMHYLRSLYACLACLPLAIFTGSHNVCQTLAICLCSARFAASLNRTQANREQEVPTGGGSAQTPGRRRSQG